MQTLKSSKTLKCFANLKKLNKNKDFIHFVNFQKLKKTRLLFFANFKKLKHQGFHFLQTLQT